MSRALLVAGITVAAAGSQLANAQTTSTQPNTPAASPARPTPCDFTADRFRSDTIPGVGDVIFFAGHVVLKCPKRSITIEGDSAERYPNRDQMIGHAVYDEPRFHVTSDFLTYFAVEDHINAAGNVHARMPSGSTLVGPVADFYRADPKAKIRPRQEIRARARPTITIVQQDSTGKLPPDSTIVVADQVYMNGDSLIYGGGQVVVTRANIGATADSAFIDQGKETMRLMRKPEVKGKKGRAFTLDGDVIDLFSRNRKLQRVIARANAVAVSDSMTLKSDTIDLRVLNDQINHAYAWGKTSRARAVSPSQNMLSDSLDVVMPSQKVQLVNAVGKALAQGRPDTVRFKVEKTDSTDWLRGDTIVAHFDTIPPKDTTKGPTIKQLVASGHASSFYHMAASDTSEHRPAINHVTARLISINFDQQKVSTVTARDSVVGVYIEPQPDSAARRAKADSTKKSTPQKKPAVKSLIPPLPPKRPPL